MDLTLHTNILMLSGCLRSECPACTSTRRVPPHILLAALPARCPQQELTYVTRLVPEDDNPEALDLFFNALNVPTGLANCLRWLLQQDPELRPKREQVAMMQFYHADCMSRHAFNTRLAWAQERADEGEVPEAANYSAYAASYVCSRPAVLDSVLECGGVKAPSE
jgi:hypothetical protein